MSSKAIASAASHSKNPLRKRIKKNPSPTSISSLPYDILLNCFSRVSRSYYRALSLVSKQFRSIISSAELYKLRSLTNRTEACLYLCLRVPGDPTTYWYTLIRNPIQTFIQIPCPHLSPAQSTSIVSVGSSIYKIGGCKPSSCRVSVLDCRFNKWRKGPRMRKKRSSPSSSLLDEKIYVAGGCRDVSSSNWVEVFDPKTETWGKLTNPGTDRRGNDDVNILGFGGELYLFGDDEYVVYDPEERKWNSLGVDAPLVACGVHVCHAVVNDVLFFWYDGVFNWYDGKASLWRVLNGCEELPDFHRREYCKIVDFGGKMAVLWDDYDCDKQKVIWCAEISLERRGDGDDDMWGKVEWCDVVHTLHWSCRLFDADVLSATV